MKTRTTLLFGIISGVLMTAPLMALLYLAEQSQGLPFVPFDLFDWLARNLPGDIIVNTIETMVDIIRRLDLGATDSTAKTVEHIQALAMFLGGGVTGGAIFFLIARALPSAIKGLTGSIVGIVFGVVFGLPLILISLDAGIYDPSEAVSGLWLVVTFGAWGAGLQWMAERLQREPAAVQDANAVVTQPAGSSVFAQQISRRAFLIRVGGATATFTVIGAGIGRYLAYLDEQEYQEFIEKNRAAAELMPGDLPNADAMVEPAPGTRPEYTPLEDHYRIDINTRPAEINGDEWRLTFDGLVDEPVEFSLADLQNNYEPIDQYVTLACISNPVAGDLTSTLRWTGASLQEILADAGLKAEATHIKISGADGFFETVALDLIESDPRIMLAYNWDGIPLLHKHGFPLRIYIPDRYGMKQPKWITGIEVMDHDEEGYWVKRGWDKDAIMNTVSVIDVVASDMTIERDGQTLVPIGGIAHAGARGISKVEIKIDDGDWVEAQLREPLSDTTWVIWRYDWPFAEGTHTFTVRATDGNGTMQSSRKQGTYPSGATGYHSRNRTL